MSTIVEITDLSAPELDVFTRLTEAQLCNRREPEKGIFIAESPKVIVCALDEGYRLPLYLFYIQELSTEEIAKALSLRPGTVRMRLSRGREMLREALKGDFFDEP